MSRTCIQEVVLIGGSTRIPKIKQLLQEFFDGKNLSMRINSDEAVACGATIQAAILSVNSKVPALEVREIVTHSLWMVKHGELIFKLRRNETIKPAWKKTLTAKKKGVTISVYEGESTRIKENNLLGLWTLKPISFSPHGVGDQFPVSLQIEENGVFSISSENNVEMQYKNTMPILSREEIDKMVADAENLKLEDDRYKKKVEAKNALETLVDHLRRSIEKTTQSELGNGNEKLVIETMRRTSEWLENNPQAVGDGFDEEYRGYVSQLNEALSSPDVRGRYFSSSSTGTGGLKINSDMEFARLVTEFSGVDLWHLETSPMSTQGRRTLLDYPSSNAG